MRLRRLMNAIEKTVTGKVAVFHTLADGEMGKEMKLTTLCYIEQDSWYLMLHRIKKENDVNRDKWIGVGGKFEPGESPEECLLREVREETGLILLEYRFRGIVTFVSDEAETEYMHLFTADCFTGSLAPCSEGELVWVPKTEIKKLRIWEGDRIFFRLMEEESRFFSLKLRYEKERLLEAVTKIYDGAP